MVTEAKRAWMAANKATIQASQARWRERNADTERAKQRAKYAADPDIVKRWARDNPLLAQRCRLRTTAKNRAKKAGLPFDLALADIQIPAVCPVLGIPLRLGPGKLADTSPSLDRVVPEDGYVRGNVRVISYRANVIKSFGSAQEHRLVADYIDREVVW